MGLQLPGSSFVSPGSALRDALTGEAVARLLSHTARSGSYLPVARIVDERASVERGRRPARHGGATHHLLHLIPQ